MEKRNLLKTALIILFIVLAGIIYSCRGVKEPGTTISLQDNSLNQTTEEVTVIPGRDELNDGKELTGVDEQSKETTADITGVNRSLSETKANQCQDNSVDSEHEYIYIHICGAVKQPDVYKVNPDTRLVEVVKLAGGLTKDAAGDYVNQAALVADGQKVYIPTKDEVKDILPEGFLNNESSIQNSVNSNTSSIEKETAVKSTLSSGKVNINKASAEELMTLSGIGESKAESIIAYRQEHGSFKSIEEIKNINGIKDSVFNKISDMITVN